MTAGVEDTRDPKELSSTENADLCAGCVKCCTYITVEVDAPRAAWEYDQWIWALHHGGIEMFVERPEHWFLHIATQCRQLQPNGRCAIHGRHPVLCREYDPRSCERRLPLADQRAWFHDAYELEAWLERERPAHWKRLMAYRKDRVIAGDAGAAGGAGVGAGSPGHGAPGTVLIPLLSLGGRTTRGSRRA
jgi:Fe-S-cluster containining protein